MPEASINFSWATLARKYPLSGVRSVPTMESATWCRTPAAASATRRLRPEVTKNSSTALSSNEGELARSITTCVPAMASLRPWPVMVLTPVLGEAATTSWPPWRRMATVFEPIRPVPPITTIFILHLSLVSQRAGSALDEGEKVGIDHVGVRRAHAVRELLVDLQGAFSEELRGERRGIGDRNDLVVVAMHDERRHVDEFQVFGEVGLREGPDTVVVRFRTAHHALAPPVLDHGLGHLRARPVVAVERPAREISIELRAVGGELLPEAVKYLDRQAVRIGWRLHHDRRHGTDEHQLRHSALAVARRVLFRSPAAGRMANVDGVVQIEMRDDRGGVRGVVVHVMTIADLARPAMASPVMSNDAIPPLHEVEHLGVPVVGAQWPAMMEDDGLRVLGAPVLVVDRRAVLHRERVHLRSS